MYHVQNKEFLINIDEHMEILWKKPVKKVPSSSRALVAVSILLSASKSQLVLWGSLIMGRSIHFSVFVHQFLSIASRGVPGKKIGRCGRCVSSN